MQGCRLSSKPALRLNSTSRKPAPVPNLRYVGPRSFHASRPNWVFNEALQLSHQAFHLVHDFSGLPWGAVIPLTACLFQVAFTPMHFFVERNNRIREQVANVLMAWKNTIQKQTQEKHGPNSTAAEVKELHAAASKAFRAKEANLKTTYKYRGQWFNFLPILYLPVWFTNISVLRAMCGETDEVEVLVRGVPEASDVSVIPSESSFATDGLAWFIDLTIADPTWMLPLAAGGSLTAVIVKSAIQRSRLTSNAPQHTLSRLIATLRQLMMLYVLSIGPLLIYGDVPSAVPLYMLGSSLTGLVRVPILSQLIRLRKGVPPAVSRRPKLKAEKKR